VYEHIARMNVAVCQVLDMREVQCLEDAARKAADPNLRREVWDIHEISQGLAALIRNDAVSPLQLERLMNMNDVGMPNVSQDDKLVHGTILRAEDLMSQGRLQNFDDQMVVPHISAVEHDAERALPYLATDKVRITSDGAGDELSRRAPEFVWQPITRWKCRRTV
jgi:hypothetical protein